MKKIFSTLLFVLTMAVRTFAQTNNDGWFEIQNTSTGQSLGSYTLFSDNGDSEDLPVVAEAITPDIQTLATALQNNPTQIFNYVHDHIKQELWFGSKKGAELTLLEQSGGDFDQCALLTALLNAAGYSDTAYYMNWVEIPYSSTNQNDLQHWLGLSLPNTNWITVSNYLNQVFGQGGYPYWYDAGDANHVLIQRPWVSVTINGTNYDLDPGFKVTEFTNGINLSTAMGLDTNALVSGAGGTSNLNYWIKGLNESFIRSNLTSCTTTLLGYLQSNYPNATVEQIVGGGEIVPFGTASLASTYQFPRLSLSYAASEESWTAIPTNYMATFSITVGTNNAFFYFPQLQGQRLSMTFGYGGTGQMWLEDSNILHIPQTGSGHYVWVDFGISYPYEPYTNLNMTISKQYQRTNATYTIIYGFDASKRWLAQREQRLNAYLSEGFTNGSRQVLTESLNIMGLTWMAETEMCDELIARQLGVLHSFHYRIGRAAREYGNGYFVDIHLALESDVSATGAGTSDVQNLCNNTDLQCYFNSAFEYGIIQQMGSSNILAVSTIRLIEAASTNNQRIYIANSANWGTIYGNITNYNVALGALVDQGMTLLVPENGLDSAGAWQGNAYATYYTNPTNALDRKLQMIIAGSLEGGYSTNDCDPDYWGIDGFDDGDPTSTDLQDPLTFTTPTSADPVDTVNGTFQTSGDDWDIDNAEPNGLHLNHYYNSARRYINTSGMASGWVNNYCCYVQQTPAPFAQLGSTTPQQMAAMAVAACAATQLYTDVNPSPKNWVMTALIAKWGIDQVVSSGLSVVMGKNAIQFVQEPDGSITPPANCTSKLTGVPGDWRLEERRGRSFYFTGAGPLPQSTEIHSMFDTWGNGMEFTYGSSGLQEVSDSWSRSLYFTYTGTNLTFVSDSDNPPHSVTFGYTANANGQLDLTSSTDSDSYTTSYTYDTNHDLTSIIDQQRRLVVTNFYDPFGHITSQYVEGQTNQQWQMFWSGWEMSVIDPAGDQETYFFDDKSRQTGHKDALGNLTQTVYDGQDHVVETISPLGESNLAIYDGNNNLIETIDPLGFSNVIAFDSSFNPVSVTDGRGGVSHYGYNAAFALVGSTNGNGDWVAYSYNPSGTLASRQDAGGTTSYSYDAYQTLSGITYPSGLGTESFVNNYSGNVVSHTDTRSFTTTFSYDNRQHLTNAVGPTNLTQSALFDSCGNLLTSTDARSRVTSNNWSATGKLLSTTLPATPLGSPVVTRSYDNRDWLASKQNPLGYTTYYTNDAAHHHVAVTDPLQRTAHMQYDGDGHMTNSADAANDQTTQNWDARGNLIKVVDAASDVVGKTYDGDGNLIFLTNRNGKLWTFQYDGANRLTNTVSPLGHAFQSFYNNRGLLQSTTDALNETTLYGYDARGRMNSKIDALATNSYQYDGNNNLTNLSVAVVGTTMSWAYDAYNRLTTFDDASGYVIQYRYDAVGNLTNLIYPGGLTVAYSYDSNNHMTNISDWSGRQTAMTYDLAGHLTSITRPNGTVRLMNYDGDGELTNIVEKTASQFPICFYAQGYNPAGRVAWEFKGPLLHTVAPPTRTMTYDNDNRLATVNGSSVSLDSDGRLIYGPGTNSTFGNYTNNARGQLMGAFGIGYRYDPLGNRIGITNGASRPWFVIDPQGSKMLVAFNGTTTNYYIYGPGLLYEIDGTSTGPTEAYYHYDSRGSTVALTDGNGNATDLIEYSAYGTVTYRIGTNTTPFLFNGQYGVQTDPNGLLYMRARYYNPYICRFVSADPSGFNGGLNFYAFCNGNPVSNTDPFGLDTISQNTPPPLSMAINPNVFPPQLAYQPAGSPIFQPQPPFYDPSLESTFTVQNLDNSMAAQQIFQIGVLATTIAVQTATADYVGDFLLLDEVTAAEGIANPVPSTLARVIQGEGPFTTLGAPGSADVFVTDASAIQGMTPAQISQTLGIPASDTYTVIQFPTPAQGLATPVFRSNPGFIGGGLTSGGAPEFVLPNGPIPSGATTTILGPH